MKEDKNEEKWDRLLRIRTTGRDDSHADQYRYPYEPTPYSVLERLAQSGRIRKKQVLLDYGCGKGRVDFFLAYQAGCRSIGIEYDDRIYEKQWRIRKLRCLPAESGWNRQMQRCFRCRRKWTGFIFSIHFPWKFFRK